MRLIEHKLQLEANHEGGVARANWRILTTLRDMCRWFTSPSSSTSTSTTKSSSYLSSIDLGRHVS